MSPTSETVCGGQSIQPISVAVLGPRPQGARGPSRQTYLFSIDNTGRTLDIRPAPPSESKDEGPQGIIVIGSSLDSQTIQANLAGARFEPDSPRTDCSQTVTYTQVDVAEADQPLLLNYMAVTRTSGALREAVMARLTGRSTTDDEACGDRRPRQVGNPDFTIAESVPGQSAWSVVKWTFDRKGRATDITTAGSSGDAAFDTEVRRATSDSVVEPGPPLTCIYNYFRRAGLLPAPVLPPLPPSAPVETPQNCPAELLSRFSLQSQPMVRAFQANGIEGWARIRFDVAPWGAIGNVTVIDAQPAQAFGEQARSLVRSGAIASGDPVAGIGCVQTVEFKIPPPADARTSPPRRVRMD